MKLIKKSILLLALAGGTFLSGGKAYAQQALVDVRVDSAAILIGEQTVLHLTVTTDKDKAVQLVIPRDTLMAGVEVLEIPKADSTLIENDRLLIKQDLLVTSFDSSLYLLPPFMVIDGADTVYSNQVALKVSTVPVNADKPEEFYDIKSVWKPPFVLADYYPWIFGVLLTLFLICVVAYVIERMRNRQSILPFREAGTETSASRTGDQGTRRDQAAETLATGAQQGVLYLDYGYVAPLYCGSFRYQCDGNDFR